MRRFQQDAAPEALQQTGYPGLPFRQIPFQRGADLAVCVPAAEADCHDPRVADDGLGNKRLGVQLHMFPFRERGDSYAEYIPRRISNRFTASP